MKTLMTGAAMALMISGTAFAAEWDANADGQVDETEFRTGLEADNPFGAWDGDRDGMLSQEEFDQGLWNSFDQDRDGFLDEPEGVTLDAMRSGWEVDEGG